MSRLKSPVCYLTQSHLADPAHATGLARTHPGQSEPPIGIEPMTYALREACAHATRPLPASAARRIATEALIALEFRGYSFHDPFHATIAGDRLSLQAEPVWMEPRRANLLLLSQWHPKVATTVEQANYETRSSSSQYRYRLLRRLNVASWGVGCASWPLFATAKPSARSVCESWQAGMRKGWWCAG